MYFEDYVEILLELINSYCNRVRSLTIKAAEITCAFKTIKQE